MGYSKLEIFEIETELDKGIKFMKYDAPKEKPQKGGQKRVKELTPMMSLNLIMRGREERVLKSELMGESSPTLFWPRTGAMKIKRLCGTE